MKIKTIAMIFLVMVSLLVFSLVALLHAHHGTRGSRNLIISSLYRKAEDKKREQPRAKFRSGVSHLLDQRLHVAQVVFECAAAGGSQLVFGLRQAAFEKFRARDVACLFEFARVDAEIAVRGVHQVLQDR